MGTDFTRLLVKGLDVILLSGLCSGDHHFVLTVCVYCVSVSPQEFPQLRYISEGAWREANSDTSALTYTVTPPTSISTSVRYGTVLLCAQRSVMASPVILFSHLSLREPPRSHFQPSSHSRTHLDSALQHVFP